MALPNYQSAKIHCPSGHLYSDDNTYYSKSNGSRKCRTCSLAKSKRQYETTIRARLGHSKMVAVKDYTLHGVWGKMIGRCYNKNDQNFSRYGGRGITVCDRWRTYNNFFDDMFIGYSKGLTIDRVDNDGNYELSNCHWATSKEQANNRSTNHNLTYNGTTKTLQQWSELYNIKSATLRHRLKNNWGVEKSLLTPVKGIL